MADAEIISSVIGTDNDSNENQTTPVVHMDPDVIDLLESEPINSSAEHKVNEAILIDKDGKRWIPIKDAAEYSGLSHSTIRRYINGKKIQSTIEQTSSGGPLTYVLMEEIENLKAVKALADSEKRVNSSDYQVEMIKVLQLAIAPSLAEISDAIGKFEVNQLQLIERVTSESKKMIEAHEESKKNDAELKQEIEELKALVKEQNERIAELEQNGRKKGFWSFFTKK